MISLNKYNYKFEQDYYEIVNSIVDGQLQNQIIQSCKNYFPDDYFGGGNNEFQTLILLPYNKLKDLYDYIKQNKMSIMEAECFILKTGKNELNDLYNQYHDLYENVSHSIRNNVKTNVKIVKENKVFTCPYCNRDYINSRGNKVSGAQLDHFYNRSKYPIFSLCLYNLVPVCGNCNRVKSSKDVTIISPFDETIDFNSSVSFNYKLEKNGDVKLIIEAQDGLENNIKIMKIEEAYTIHDLDVKELIDKVEIYNKTQQNEIVETFKNFNIPISDNEFKKLVFGNDIEAKEFGKKPLSKLKYDILKKLDIIQ